MSGNHTPTPWKVSPGHVEGAVTIRQDSGEFQRPVAEVWHNGDDPKANAELIVTAVNSFASSQAEIQRLRTALAFYRDGFQFHTNPRRAGLEWKPTEALLDDCGNIARIALAEHDTALGSKEP